MVRFLALRLCLMTQVCLVFGVSPRFVAKIVTIEVNNSNSLYDMRRFGPAINMALSTIKETYGKHIDFRYEYKDIECSAAKIGSAAAEAYHKTGVNVFIGPACVTSVEPLGYMAKEWNIPVITPVGYKGILKNKTLFPTVTRLSPFGQDQFADFTMQMLEFYGWKHVAIIYDDSDSHDISSLMGSTFVDSFMETDYEWTDFAMSEFDLNDQGYENVLKESSENARIFIIHASVSIVRQMLLVAHRMGMTSGEYAFIVTVSLRRVISPDVWRIGDGRDEVALEAFQSAFFLALMESDESELEQFQRAVRMRSMNKHDIDIGYDDFTDILGYYDAFQIYAEVLNETLAEGLDPNDGRQISLRMWNRTYQGISGPIILNENGGKDANLALLDFTARGEVVAVGMYTGRMKTYKENPGMSIIWPANSGPPLDVPECGFKGYRCEYKSSDGKLIGGLSGSLSSVLIIALIISGVYVRKWKIARKTERWWWMVDESQLQMSSNNDKLSAQSITSKFSSITPKSDLIPANQANLAVYKGCPVHMKKLTMKNVTYEKQLLDEFEYIRSLNHPNLVRIIAASLQGDDKYILTEYCAKGSLQEMIGNSEIKMDNELKFALCLDVIKGLCFLHESPLRHHGRLSSAVCLVDNRFMVKLTDFGPHYVFSRQTIHDDSQEFQQECLWRAPELLRSNNLNGSQQGDVYSFGILLKEIFTGDTPYAVEIVTMGTDYVIEKIMQTDTEPFRPEFHVPECLAPVRELAIRCWSELPNHRPLLANVKRDINQMAKDLGASGSLMDSLLRRMEQYANKLERLVDDKTLELKEEKKKTEDLLDQILPRSVANQLKLGQRVEPDSFDSVTVCFTDICGFTTFSSQSSPVQVVDLLNNIYSCFDDIIDSYDVYKVETIGDSYMVVSGLPVRNGDQHASEISRMSLHLLEAIDHIKIDHLPEDRLKLRIGLHSGSVCAGVVGIKMPRYCLFGDTVNTASRMESHGEEGKIHISGNTKKILARSGPFIVEHRGAIEVKGKGKMDTYWLLGEEDNGHYGEIY